MGDKDAAAAAAGAEAQHGPLPRQSPSDWLVTSGACCWTWAPLFGRAPRLAYRGSAAQCSLPCCGAVPVGPGCRESCAVVAPGSPVLALAGASHLPLPPLAPRCHALPASVGREASVLRHFCPSKRCHDMQAPHPHPTPPPHHYPPTTTTSHPPLQVGNSSAEAATEWVFAHMEDPDFNSPLPEPGKLPLAAPPAPPAPLVCPLVKPPCSHELRPRPDPAAPHPPGALPRTARPQSLPHKPT